MKKYINKLGLAAITTMCSWSAAMAQDAVATAAPVGSNGTDTAVWTLFGVAVVLLIGIAILAFALLRITQYTLNLGDKSKAALALIGMLLITQVSFAQDAAAAAAPKATSFSINLIVAVAVVLIELILLIFLAMKLLSAINMMDPKTKEAKAAAPSLMDQFNASVALEKEKDILLDHDYDGIRELDNNLPPWWLWGFYISIVWAIAYFSYYHVVGMGASSTEAYAQEMEVAKAEIDAYMKTAGNNIDENSVKLDPAMVADGKKLFAENCKACHGESGGSAPGAAGIGPNLTDEYWIHGGSIQEVFKSIKYGWPDKGMKSWQSDFSGGQIAQLANFVMSIQGTNPPNAKEPQGTKVGGAAPADSTATTTAVADTTKK